jgi:hypothetical protein
MVRTAQMALTALIVPFLALKANEVNLELTLLYLALRVNKVSRENLDLRHHPLLGLTLRRALNTPVCLIQWDQPRILVLRHNLHPTPNKPFKIGVKRDG